MSLKRHHPSSPLAKRALSLIGSGAARPAEAPALAELVKANARIARLQDEVVLRRKESDGARMEAKAAAQRIEELSTLLDRERRLRSEDEAVVARAAAELEASKGRALSLSGSGASSVLARSGGGRGSGGGGGGSKGGKGGDSGGGKISAHAVSLDKLRKQVASLKFQVEFANVKASDRDMLAKKLKIERSEFLRERRVFTQRYTKLEDRLAKAEAEKEDVVLQLMSARNALVFKDAELAQYRTEIEQEKKAWRAELAEMKAELVNDNQIKEIIYNRNLEREMNRGSLLSSNRPSTPVETAIVLSRWISSSPARRGGRATDDESADLSTLERALKRIQGVTGEENLDAALHAFVDVDDSNKDLVSRLHMAQTDLSVAKDTIAQLERELERHSSTYDSSSHKKILRLENKVHVLESEKTALTAQVALARKTFNAIRAGVFAMGRAVGTIDESATSVKDTITEANIMMYIGLLEEKLTTLANKRAPTVIQTALGETVTLGSQSNLSDSAARSWLNAMALNSRGRLWAEAESVLHYHLDDDDASDSGSDDDPDSEPRSSPKSATFGPVRDARRTGPPAQPVLASKPAAAPTPHPHPHPHPLRPDNDRNPGLARSKTTREATGPRDSAGSRQIAKVKALKRPVSMAASLDRRRGRHSTVGVDVALKRARSKDLARHSRSGSAATPSSIAPLSVAPLDPAASVEFLDSSQEDGATGQPNEVLTRDALRRKAERDLERVLDAPGTRQQRQRRSTRPARPARSAHSPRSNNP